MRKPKKVIKPTYIGEDPAQFIWSNRTHRSVSEAFRDADYATPIWRCKTEWERTREYIGWTLMWAFVLFSLYALAVWFNEVVS
jgi:hypothetical protein